jgi:hypothetical protein
VEKVIIFPFAVLITVVCCHWQVILTCIVTSKDDGIYGGEHW